ncbi:MAG: OsmC family protein [Dehalococcoidia bacterium]|nr:OsmC family protein [Dehalococcoidia bacterium]
MTVKAEWVSNSRFVATSSTGNSIVLDPDGEGFKPSELLLAGLAGCTGVDVVGILRKQRQKLAALEIEVTGKQMDEPPWTFQEIHVEYILRGSRLKKSAVARAIELSETKYCSVGATISATVKITSSFRIIEEAPSKGDV